MKRTFYLIGLLALTAASYPAYDPGGSVVAAFAGNIAAQERGETVEIRGVCLSSCALKLAAPKVCVEPSAQIGVHEVRRATALDYANGKRDEMATAFFEASLPTCARKLFASLGGFSSGRLVTVRGSEVLAACPNIGACP